MCLEDIFRATQEVGKWLLVGGGGFGYNLPTSNKKKTTQQTTVHSRVKSGIFFDWSEQVNHQRSGMILEVQIQIFGALASKFSFSTKIPGGPNINIFV